MKLATGAPDRVLEKDARCKLLAYGVPEREMGELHVLVSSRGKRRYRKGIVPHVHEGELPARSLLALGGGCHVVDIRLCALQAARDLGFYELVEYYYELCGSYELPFDADEAYRERPPLTSTRELRHFFEQMEGTVGIGLAWRALRYVRDGARSPMETALIMMLVMPKSEGGLGIRGIEMDYRIDVQRRVQGMTKRRYFLADMYISRARLDIEYNGIIHEEAARDAMDGERENTLRAMGYDVVTVRRHAFFYRESFLRVMEAIRQRAGVRPSSIPVGFEMKQELLRQFVLRRML